MTREWWTFSRIWTAVIVGAIVIFGIVAAVGISASEREQADRMECLRSGLPGALCD